MYASVTVEDSLTPALLAEVYDRFKVSEGPTNRETSCSDTPESGRFGTLWQVRFCPSEGRNPREKELRPSRYGRWRGDGGRGTWYELVTDVAPLASLSGAYRYMPRIDVRGIAVESFCSQ